MCWTNLKKFLFPATAILLLFGALSSTQGDQERQQKSQERQGPDPTRYSPLAAKRARDPSYKPRKSFIEASLELINPDNYDYGAAYERSKARIKQEILLDRRMQVIAGLSLVSSFLLLVTWVQRRDGNTVLKIGSEFMADLYNDMELARVQAEKMTDRYNQHIEICNREYEQGEVPTAGQVDELREEVKTLRKELANKEAESLRSKDRLATSEATKESSAAKEEALLLDRLEGKNKEIEELKSQLDGANSKKDAAVGYITKLQREIETLPPKHSRRDSRMKKNQF